LIQHLIQNIVQGIEIDAHILIATTSQIYKLHKFIPNLWKICYFIGLYCLHTNVMHYLNTKVMCMTFGYKQHKQTYNTHV
jgi:hypothetical protein